MENGSADERSGLDVGTTFERTFAEPLEKFLDLGTWYSGHDLDEVYGRLSEELEQNVEAGIAAEDAVAVTLRRNLFPELRRLARVPLAGHWHVSLEEIEEVHRSTLFAGHVEACDGLVQVHDSLALTVMQFGIGLIGYRGDEGTWSCRLFRRDLSGNPPDAYAQAMALVEAREPAPAQHDPHGQVVSELGRRGLASFAQRAVLARRSDADWRMGAGTPAPFELLTGSGSLELVEPAVEVLSELLLDRQFVFVPEATRERGLLTVGNALGPLEFAVLRLLRTEIEDVVDRGHLRGRQRSIAQEFVDKVGGAVAVGVFRASRWAPPRVFYAPADRRLCAQAATIAIADAVLQEHRGYPLLLEMARQFCASAFNHADFEGPIRAAYAAHDRAIAYLSDG